MWQTSSNEKENYQLEWKGPILFIYYNNDPWFDYDNCKGFVKKRNNATLLELKGSKHETSSNKIARDAVESFLQNTDIKTW